MGDGADLALSSGQGWEQGAMLRSGWVHYLPVLQGSSSPGWVRSHAHPPWPHFPEGTVPAVSPAAAAPAPSSHVCTKGHGNSPAKGTCWSQGRQAGYSHPRGGQGSREVADGLAESLAWEHPQFRGIKLCSDTQILGNSENGGKGQTPKPEFMPWRARSDPGGL